MSLTQAVIAIILLFSLNGCGGGTDNTQTPAPTSNTAPDFASTPSLTITENQTYSYDITATDSDTADTLTITAPTKPEWLTLTDNGNRTALLTGTPDSGDIGNHTITLAVTDNAGTSAQQNFDILVSASSPSSFTVTASAGTGGTVSPTEQEVTEGNTASFVVTASDGYSINSVTGCSGSISGTTYVTGIITESCTVIAIFNNNNQAELTSFIQAIANGDAEPVIVNGEEWTFRTAPPSVGQRTVRSDHPRLLLTTDNLPAIKVKLQDPVYDPYMTMITARANDGNMLENAFLYQITGDISRAEAARQALLDYSGDYGERIIFGYDKMSNRLGPVLVMDWIMDMLTSTEKAQIFANVKDNFAYDHKTADPVHTDGNGAGSYPWYWNDIYNRLPEIFLPALAFAIAGDGIDDAWANEVIAWAYDEDETRVIGPYGPNRGSGFLDVLMTISLDTGGASGTNQYYSYWVEVLHAIAFWETATGQPMWNRTPFMIKSPQSLLTSRDGVSPSARIMSAIEFITGVADGDVAALAKYTTEYYGVSSYHTVYRAILGDMRITAKTPAELNIPTAKYLRGDHVFYSKDSWDDDAVSLYVRSPYINIGRGPGSDGVFAIDIGKGQPLAPRVEISKTQETAGHSSGMWIYDPADNTIQAKSIPIQNKGTNWGWNNGRSYDAWTTVSEDGYFEGGPESIKITNDYRAISMEYGQRYDRFTINRAQRTIVHIPDGNRNFIVIYDYIDLPATLKSAWQIRLMEEPSINGSVFSIPGVMKATVVSPQNHTLEWLGGLNNEFVTPSPERLWYTNRKGGSVPGYSVDRPDRINGFGLGNLYIQPAGQKDSSQAPFVEQTEYLVVIEISDQGPVNVTRVSDNEVSFGQWQVQFSPDGTYTVTTL